MSLWHWLPTFAQGFLSGGKSLGKLVPGHIGIDLYLLGARFMGHESR